MIDWAPYLGKLGVGAILLNPVFSSDTHGYNTRDMLTIDCRLGTNQDFKETVDALHACGVRVVLDAVFKPRGTRLLGLSRRAGETLGVTL